MTKDSESIIRKSLISKLDKLIEGINASSLQLIDNYKKRKKNELSADDKKILRYLLTDLKETKDIINESVGIEEKNNNSYIFDILPNFLKQANVYYFKFKESKNLSDDISNLRKLYSELNNIKSSCNQLTLGYWDNFNFKKSSDYDIIAKNYNLMISSNNKKAMEYVLLKMESHGGNAGISDDKRICGATNFIANKKTGEIKEFLGNTKVYNDQLNFRGVFVIATGEYNEIIKCYISNRDSFDREPYKESKIISQTAKDVLKKCISIYNKNSISIYNNKVNSEKGILFKIKKFIWPPY